MQKYEALCHKGGLDFSPFVLESTGAWGKAAQNVLDMASENVHNKRGEVAQKFKRRWSINISVALVRSLALGARFYINHWFNCMHDEIVRDDFVYGRFNRPC